MPARACVRARRPSIPVRAAARPDRAAPRHVPTPRAPCPRADAAISNPIQPAPTNEFFQMDNDFYPLYTAASGGKQLIEDGKATFDDATGDRVADLWRTFYEEGLSSPEQYQGDAFADGYAAMAIVGPWAVGYYKDEKKTAETFRTINGCVSLQGIDGHPSPTR